MMILIIVTKTEMLLRLVLILARMMTVMMQIIKSYDEIICYASVIMMIITNKSMTICF